MNDEIFKIIHGVKEPPEDEISEGAPQIAQQQQQQLINEALEQTISRSPQMNAILRQNRSAEQVLPPGPLEQQTQSPQDAVGSYDTYAVSAIPRCFSLLRTCTWINPDVLFKNVGEHLIFLYPQYPDGTFAREAITLNYGLQDPYSFPYTQWIGFKLKTATGYNGMIDITVQNAYLRFTP